MGEDMLEKASEARETKARTDKWDDIKLKTSAKYAVKRQPTVRENICKL